MSSLSVDARRVRPLNDKPVGSGPVLYVVAREQRVKDNWALLYAAAEAKKRAVPLLVLFALGPQFKNGSARHNEWMVASLRELSENLAKKNIPFFLEMGEWSEVVHSFVVRRAVGQVVFDFNPLEPVRSWREEAAHKIPCTVVEIDARNIVPCWEASPKAEFAAYTFRPKVQRALLDFLGAFPSLPYFAGTTIAVPAIDWEAVRAFRQCDYTEPVPVTYTPGERAAHRVLKEFLEERLSGYASRRNDPTQDGVSNLSPYLRWGNISAQRIALEMQAVRGVKKEDKDAFLEELIVRRELSDNYVFYTKQYDTLAGAHAWAQATLNAHRRDVREYTYTKEQFATAKTHDPLWNAMQMQLVTEGKMHGWCRMYWAKKILEWTRSPEEAIEIALYLNDYYELDGRESNGVVGVMWSIAGVHDRAWTERAVFGKIRYMNFAGAKRKFDVATYIERYGKDTLFS